MPLYVYAETDVVITKRPCLLHSIIVSTIGGGPGRVNVYNAEDAEEPYRVAVLLSSGNESQTFSWKGLELNRGLFIDIAEKADFVTIEWEPIG